MTDLLHVDGQLALGLDVPPVLGGPGLAHRDDPETARAAARPNRVGQRERVLIALAERGGYGAIPEEIKADLGYPGGAHVIATRLSELCERGLVAKSGDHRPTWSGCEAECWVVLPEGAALALSLREQEDAQ